MSQLIIRVRGRRILVNGVPLEGPATFSLSATHQVRVNPTDWRRHGYGRGVPGGEVTIISSVGENGPHHLCRKGDRSYRVTTAGLQRLR